MNNFKIGDTVICIDANGASGVTLGNYYKVHRAGTTILEIINDVGMINFLNYTRFKLKANNFKTGDNVICINFKDKDVIQKKVQKDQVYQVLQVDDEPEDVFLTSTYIGGKNMLGWFYSKTFEKVPTNIDLIIEQFEPYIK